MKKAWLIGCKVRIAATVVAFLAGGACLHAEQIVSSSWDDGLDGWLGAGAATLSNPGGVLNVQFPPQIAPEYSAVMIEKDFDTAFRPTHISFKFRAPEVLPSSLRVYIQSSSGRSWYKPLAVAVTGDWVLLSVAVDYASGWILGPISTQADFEADMNDVKKISVLIVRNGKTASHEFSMDDFVVDGLPVTGGSQDSDGDGMLDSWELANGLDPTSAADAEADDDNDGLSNQQEYLAGTAPRDPSSTLSIAIEASLDEQMQAAGYVLTWPSALGRRYQLWKATDLVAGFYMLQGGILATPPVNVYVDESAVDDASSFYRIELE